MTGAHRRQPLHIGRAAAVGASLALVLAMIGIAWAATPTATTDDALTLRQVCEAALRASPSLSSADRTWAQRCARVAVAAGGVLSASASPSLSPTPGPSPSVSPTPSPTPTSSPTQSPSSTPSPSPTPTPGPTPLNCRVDPSACSYPDADNTGVPPGTVLTVVASAQGYIDVTVAGTVFDSKDIRGCLIIKAPNVTVRNSKVSCSNYGVIYSVPWNYSGGGTLVEDSEISCNNTIASGISSYGVTARRVNIHHCADGINVDSEITLEDSYIHDLIDPATGAHTDAVQMQGTPVNITIRHNTLFADCCPYGNSAITSAGGSADNVLIQNNFLGGGTYTLYCPQVTVPAGAFQVLGNRFADGMQEYGLSLSCDGGDITWSGNYRDSDGSVVNP